MPEDQDLKVMALKEEIKRLNLKLEERRKRIITLLTEKENLEYKLKKNGIPF